MRTPFSLISKLMSKDIEKALIKATGSLKNDGGKPRDVYCPEFGWIILNGNTTAVYKEWLTKVESDE
jgi:hypothetical protein